MANTLIKETQIVTTVGYEEVPAIPYRPATPPRTAYESRQVCSFRYAGPGHYEFITDPQTLQTTAVWVPNSIGQNSGGLQSTWICDTVAVPVTIPGSPAQPYVPGYTRTTTSLATGYNLGWNAGARSLSFFRGDGYVEFKVRESVVGVICGINFYDGVDAGYNGNTVDFAFYCARGRAWIIRNGTMGASVGTYTGDTVFRIERLDTDVIFYKDGGTVQTVSSGVPTADGWLEACLYSGNDEVYDPVLVQTSAPDLTAQTGEIEASFERMSVFASEGPYAELVAGLPALSVAAEAGLAAPAFALGDFQLPALSMSLEGLTGETATGDMAFERLDMLAADHPYGEISASMSPLAGEMLALEGNLNASLGGLVQISSGMSASSLLVVTMSSQGIVSAAMATDMLLSADMLSRAALGTAFDVDAILEAVMWSLASSGAVLRVPESESETWVINLTSQGTTTYSNFGFNSFAQIGTRFYGASARGIVELVGDTDDGAPIDASISLGELDFATALKKTVSHCYIGTSGEGHLFVKLIVEGREFVYKAESFSEQLRQHRVKFGKGLRENYVSVEIHNADGADFEIDTVEFHLADLTRRI